MLNETVRLLTSHVDQLLRQVRSEVNPTPGQILDLADMNRRVLEDLDQLAKVDALAPQREVCQAFGCEQHRAPHDAQYCPACLVRVATLRSTFPMMAPAKLDAFMQSWGRA